MDEPIGRFQAGIAALIWSASPGKYLLLRRSANKDFGPGIWECVTGRLNQGEGFEDALHREVREELGVEVNIEAILGTTHFFRGASTPENELVGVVYLCTLENPLAISIGPEHSESHWLTADEAVSLLSAADSSTQWMKQVIERAEVIRPLLLPGLIKLIHQDGFELG